LTHSAFARKREERPSMTVQNLLYKLFSHKDIQGMNYNFTRSLAIM